MGILFPNWGRTWGGRFTLAFIIITIFSRDIIFLFISVVLLIFTVVGHKFFVTKIRKKYGDDLFRLDAYQIHEVKTYYSTLTKKEQEEDKDYIRRMIERRGY